MEISSLPISGLFERQVGGLTRARPHACMFGKTCGMQSRTLKTGRPRWYFSIRLSSFDRVCRLGKEMGSSFHGHWKHPPGSSGNGSDARGELVGEFSKSSSSLPELSDRMLCLLVLRDMSALPGGSSLAGNVGSASSITEAVTLATFRA